MRHHPHTLGEAREIATRLDYETKDGGPEINACPICTERVFVTDGYRPDGITAYGYCLNPGCGYSRVARNA